MTKKTNIRDDNQKNPNKPKTKTKQYKNKEISNTLCKQNRLPTDGWLTVINVN